MGSSGNKKGGIFGKLIAFIFLVIAIGLAVALVKASNANSIDEFWDYLVVKGGELGEWLGDQIDNAGTNIKKLESLEKEEHGKDKLLKSPEKDKKEEPSQLLSEKENTPPSENGEESLFGFEWSSPSEKETGFEWSHPEGYEKQTEESREDVQKEGQGKVESSSDTTDKSPADNELKVPDGWKLVGSDEKDGTGAKEESKATSNDKKDGEKVFSLTPMEKPTEPVPTEPKETIGWNVEKEPDREPEEKEIYSPDPRKYDFDSNEDSPFYGYKKYNTREIKEKLDSLIVAPLLKVSYNEATWKRWKPVGDEKSCWNTREEVLLSLSKPNRVILRDKGKRIISDGRTQTCYISNGLWDIPFSGERFTNASKLDVVHVVPIPIASSSGGNNWDRVKKVAFSNDIEDNLILLSMADSLERNNRPPSGWMPKEVQSHCQYAKKYVNVLYKYDITITAEDKDILATALETCQD